MTIAGMTLYQICWYFMFYSFSGWVVEVIYHACTAGKVINRGFLNGPVCPVYGFGMLAVLSVSNLAVSGGYITVSASEMNVHSLLLLFAGSLIFATLVELTAGWMLDALFHMRWWDYSRKPLNFHGYICLEFSIIWGLSITAVILLIHPMMERSRSFGIPEKIGWPVLGIMYAAAFADLVVTVAAINGLNRRLEELDRIQQNMRTVSDRLSRSIGENTIKTAQTIGEGQVQAALARAELRDAVAQAREEQDLRNAQRKAAFDRKKEDFTRKTTEWSEHTLAELEQRKKAMELRRTELVWEIHRASLTGPGRILKNVPNLRHSRYREILESLKHFPETSAAEKHSKTDKEKDSSS